MTRRITPVIMCGGAGTRLWPSSRESFPKQFIPFFGERSSFQDTVLRVADGTLFEEPVVITSRNYGHLVADQLEALEAKATILLEPMRRDSGPAIAAAASFVRGRDPGTIMLVVAADHVIRDVPAFLEAVAKARDAAAGGHLMLFGIEPDRPATGYGYIRPGTAEIGPGCFKVEAFIEKPDIRTARSYVDQGYLWNSGNFIFDPQVLLDEYARFDAATVTAAADAVARATSDLGRIVLDAGAFAACTVLSIDFAVMERSDRVGVVPVSMSWSDIGGWNAIWELKDKDEAGNAGPDSAVFQDARDNLVLSDGLVCLVGVDNLAVISAGDALLVFDRSKGDAVKELVARLKAENRKEVAEHLRVFRPWGSYQSIDSGARFQVKRIVVKPGGRLSLQKHFHRAEHWVVVRGTARVTIGDRQMILHENESTYIPLGEVHRLENPGKIPLEIIEVQSGSYLGEDDIVRLEDVYNRT
ncbi:MAG TPA: mannose-1-phosphate guanylyltransferase/mannose-6-phosphate isomerase [Beijerinckiaceae bacterium]|jgi:mannose-1-phosphate guanylyltransferase/mannose-6-phosphate isomerase